MNVKGFRRSSSSTASRRPPATRRRPVARAAAFGASRTRPRHSSKFAGGAQRTERNLDPPGAHADERPWLARQTDPEKGERFAVANSPSSTTRQERHCSSRCTPHADRGRAREVPLYLARDGDAGRKARLADVLWSLLNSQEFLLNT